MSKNLKVILTVFIGIVLIGVGVVATILLVQQLQSKELSQQISGDVIKTNVVVVTRDLKLGDRIESGDVEIISVPVEAAPRDILTQVENAVGKYVTTDMIQGEMVLLHNLADPTNNNHDLSFILSDDHILMAFQPGDIMTHENIIQRGDIIDIFATFKEEVKEIPETTTTTSTTVITGAQEEPVTRTFTLDGFQKVSVTALVLDIVSPETRNNSTGEITPATTTISSYLLAMDPQDALILKHLQDTGADFDLVLRAPTSTGDFNLTPVTADYIVEFYGLEILP